jgi:hypothetical protein
MSPLHRIILALSFGSAGLLLLSAAPASAVPDPTAAPPHIVARPDNLMVNTDTTLTGTGFPPDRTLTVEECSETTWIVPQNPCATSNIIHVHTTLTGRFRHEMKAEVCPAPGSIAPPGFAERCYVGVPRPTGVDVIVLVGAARITVTGP